jgi:polyhydroxyalkanoate synthesis regulator phasin
MTNKKTIATLVAGLVAGGAAGFAFGVPALTSAAPVVVQQLDGTGSDTGADAATDVDVNGDVHDDDHRGAHGPRGGGRGPAPEVLAEILGLDVDTLRAEFEAGMSVADVAEAQGIDTQTVVDGLVADLADHLAEHVADGSLTQDEADAKLANAATMISDRIDDVPPVGGREGDGPGAEGRGPRRGVSDEVLALLGIDAETLRVEFGAGNSLADVATANGVDVQAVIDQMVTEGEAHIAEHVADGSLTQDEADARLADLESQITERVNSVPPAMSEGGHGGRGPGSRGPGGRGHGGPGGHGELDGDMTMETAATDA